MTISNPSAAVVNTQREMPPLSVCLVAPVSGMAQGGTAAYIRYLGNELARDCQVSGISRTVNDVRKTLAYEYSEGPTAVDLSGWQTRIIASQPLLRPGLHSLTRLLPRRAFQPTCETVFSMAYGAGLRQALPENLDVVHYVGTGWELFGVAALREARRRGASVVVTPFVHPGTWGDSPLDLQFYAQADAVLVCTDLERDYLVSRGLSAERIHHIGLGPAVSDGGDGARFRTQFGLKDRPLVLFLARKQRYKGYHVLCEAMRSLIREYPDVCLVGAGTASEPPYPELPKENFLDLGELKPVPEDERVKADALAAADIFCMPSEAEAFGIAYVEAWAYGTPVIAGMAPALAELIEEGVTGFRVEQKEEAVAGALRRLLRDPELRRKMGSAGYALQQERFTWKSIAREHQRIYRTLRQSHNSEDK